MKKFLLSTVLLSLFTSTAFAAKFRVIHEVASLASNDLAVVAALIAQDEDNFGDAGLVEAYAITRKASESDLNTMKQLNHQKVGLNSDDTAAVDMSGLSAKKLAEHLMEVFSNMDDQDQFTKTKANLEKALKLVLKDKTLKIYGTSHADEDGSWQVLNILDNTNNQVVLIKLGFNGT